jgi:hypothetical protein
MKTIFKQLRTGRHVCRADGADFRDLERFEEEYSVLFQSLGYELVHHEQGFYFLKGDDQLSSRRLQAIAIFVLIMFQDLEDRKYENKVGMWEKELVTKSFEIESLPHFAIPRRREMMKRVGVVDVETLKDKVLRPMKSLGMLEDASKGAIRFRAPVYRIVDICIEIASQEPEGSPSEG